MPNIKSAKKRVLVINKKTAENRMIKSAYKTSLKKFDTAVAEGNVDAAKACYADTVSRVDMTCSKGIIHKNKANRVKAQLSKKLASVSAE